jgi:hypothetical protein
MNQDEVYNKNGAILCLVCLGAIQIEKCGLTKCKKLFFADVQICNSKAQADKFGLAETSFQHYL